MTENALIAADARLKHFIEREAELKARTVAPDKEELKEAFLRRLKSDIADTIRELGR